MDSDAVSALEARINLLGKQLSRIETRLDPMPPAATTRGSETPRMLFDLDQFRRAVALDVFLGLVLLLGSWVAAWVRMNLCEASAPSCSFGGLNVDGVCFAWIPAILFFVHALFKLCV